MAFGRNEGRAVWFQEARLSSSSHSKTRYQIGLDPMRWQPRAAVTNVPAETWETDEETEEDGGEDELLESLTEEEKLLLQDLDGAQERDGNGSPGTTGGPPTMENSDWEGEDEDGFLDDLGEDGEEALEGEEVQIEALSPEDLAELEEEAARESSEASTSEGDYAKLREASGLASFGQVQGERGGSEGAGPRDAVPGNESEAFAVALAKIAWDTKASDITVLHVAPLVYWTSYMVLASVTSRPQMNAVVGKVERAALESFGRSLSSSRPAGRSQWEVMDYGDVVLHIFTPEQRDFYDLESFYGAAPEIALPFLSQPPAATPLWTQRP